MGAWSTVVAEWFARVYASGNSFNVVVEGLGVVQVNRSEAAEAAARDLILGRLHASYPSRGKPWNDPAAVALYQFEVEVRSSTAYLSGRQ